MKTAGLFAGIGGLELGLTRAGHQTDFVCEISKPAREVLRRHLKNADLFGDIRDLADLPANIDIVAAGFPCQDLSQAGATAGISGARSGLVNEIFRLAKKRRPRWIVLENVPFMLRLADGAAMLHVVNSLENLGYRWAWRVVDAFGFGVPKRRERVFIVASTEGDPADVLLVDDAVLPRPDSRIGTIAHGFYWTEGRGGLGWAANAVPTLKNGSTVGIPSPPAILLPNGRIIKPDLRDAERLQGFPEDWTLPTEKVAPKQARWGLIGNAVCVPIATWIGRRLADPGTYDRRRDSSMLKGDKLPRAARFDGSKRMVVDIGPDPIGLAPPSLTSFLRYPGVPLSARATAGFLDRTRRSTLHFQPGFLKAVEAHLAAHT